MTLEIRDLASGDSDSDSAWIVEAHGRLYAADEGFDASFPKLVAGILAGFEAGHDPARERAFIACEDGRRMGCIFCVAADADTAKLRLFLVEPAARGRGLGRRLLRDWTEFARGAGYRHATLWTHESHRAACALYAAEGWRLVSASPAHSFGVDVVEQHWARDL